MIWRKYFESSMKKPDRPRESVSKVIREGVTVGLANHTILISRDGKECPVDDSGAPIRNRKSDNRRCAGLRDVSDRKQAEHEREEITEPEHEARERAETSSRIKDEFLATYHTSCGLPDCNAWLSRLLTQGRLTRSIKTCDRSHRTKCHIAESDCYDLLDMSRVITGKMRLELIPLNLAPV